MNYVTYSDLLAYTVMIIALLALVLKDNKRK